MKKPIFFISALVILNLMVGEVLAATKSKAKPAQAKGETQELLTDPNKVISVNEKTARFSINLKSNPSTGYGWVLVDDYNFNVITPASHTFTPSKTKLVGAPGYETFTFSVKQDGFNVPQKLHLTFQYVRPWVVKDNTKKLTFTIITRENGSGKKK